MDLARFARMTGAVAARRTRIQDRVNAELERRLGLKVVRQQRRGRVRAPKEPTVDRLVTSPVFLCSSVRSGSTLLRSLLDSHSRIHAPHETHFRRLEVVPVKSPVLQAMDALDLNMRDLEHLLWDRLLDRELRRSGKDLIVEKTPSNVFVVDRLKTAWPDARFLYLIRHPYSIARSWHEGKPDERPMSRAVPYTLNFMEHVERARTTYPGLTVRYEDLTADPERETRRVCEHLGLEWEAGMLEYGRKGREYVAGIGDWTDKIKSGSVQAGRPLPAPDEVPSELREMCRVWGY
jgi:hypothetical protein